MRGNDDNDRPRPIFSRSSDGRLHAGGAHIAPVPYAEDETEPAPPHKTAPILVIPPKQPAAPAPAPHHLKIVPGTLGPQPSSVHEPVPQSRRAPVHTVVPTTVLKPAAAVETPLPPQMETVPKPVPQAASMDPGSASDAIDVGDLWSEQERIRLQEAWENEQRKAARKQRRKELLRKKVTGIPSPGDQPKKTGEAVAPTEPAHTDPKEITLNISMPSLPKVTLPKLHIPALPRISRQRAMLFGSVAGVLVVSAVGYNVYKHYHTAKVTASGSKVETVNGIQIKHLDASKQTGTPDYSTVLPAGKTVKDFGGWVRVSPPDKNPVYAYADQIDNVLINVSEQPVPDSFKKDIDTSMDDLATHYSANDKMQIGTVTAYVGTSIKGPQSVLFVKGDLLILIKSAAKITDNHWQTYIRSLQ